MKAFYLWIVFFLISAVGFSAELDNLGSVPEEVLRLGDDLPRLTNPARVFPNNELPVIIIAGQSNAVGPSGLGEFVPHPGVDSRILFSYRMKSKISPKWIHSGRELLSLQLQEGRGGAEISLARQFLRSLDELRGHRNSQLGIIKFAVGGTSLAKDWRMSEGSQMNLSEANDCKIPRIEPQSLAALFRQRYNFIRTVMAEQLATRGLTPKIVGIVWIQGESDTTCDNYAASYQSNLTHFMRSVRTVAGDLQTPIIIARVNRNFESSPNRTNRILTVARAQKAFVMADGHAELISGDDLDRQAAQPIHYTFHGLQQMGVRAYLKLFSRILRDHGYSVPEH